MFNYFLPRINIFIKGQGSATKHGKISDVQQQQE